MDSWWVKRLCFFPQPKIVTESDELELAKQMERLEKENAEVDGDDDNPDDEDAQEAALNFDVWSIIGLKKTKQGLPLESNNFSRMASPVSLTHTRVQKLQECFTKFLGGLWKSSLYE